MAGDLKMLNRYTNLKYILLLLSVASVSCRNGSEEKSAVLKPGANEMADLNRYMVRKTGREFRAISKVRICI